MESKYNKLNDKKWLHQKYVIEGKGTNRIANIVGCKAANSVRQALIRHNISVRNISNGLTYNRKDDFLLSDVALQIIIGSLLGDGFLRKHNKYSDNSYPYFAKRNKFKDHVEYVAQNIFTDHFNKYISVDININFGKRLVYHIIRTHVQKSLLDLYKRWYPENNYFKKIVPKDIELTPIVLLNWFMDDGNSYRRKRKTRQIIITFCAESFTSQDQLWLIDEMQNKYGISCSLRNVKFGTGCRIEIKQSYADIFYDIIGKCPVPSMKYKWK